MTRLLLISGAKTYHTNSLGRTANQMAGFVGNHAIVALINNYVPKSDVDYYTVPNGLEKEPKLPSEVSQPLYDVIMQVIYFYLYSVPNLPDFEVVSTTINYLINDISC